MKRFHFRLDSVLRYRRYLEQIAQLQLGIAEQSFINCKEKIDLLEARRRTFLNELAQEEHKGMSTHIYQIYQLHMGKIGSDLKFEKQHLKKLIVNRDRKRKALKSATIKRKSLEHLKGIEYSRHKRECSLSEQKSMDELILLRKKSVPGYSRGTDLGNP